MAGASGQHANSSVPYEYHSENYRQEGSVLHPIPIALEGSLAY
jgi:hypothetical protein